MTFIELSEVLGNLGEFVGSFAVLATLIYLAVQVRNSKDLLDENRKQLELQSYQSWVAANLEINIAMTDPTLSATIALGNESSLNLSKESFPAYGMAHMSMLQMAQSTDYLYRSGSLDKVLWESEMNRAAGILSIPGVRQFWDAGGKSQLTPTFVEFLESIQSTMDYVNWDSDRGFYQDSKLLQR